MFIFIGGSFTLRTPPMHIFGGGPDPPTPPGIDAPGRKKKGSLSGHAGQVKGAIFLFRRAPPLLPPLVAALACDEFVRPNSASLRPGNTASFEKMLQRWRTVDNTVSDLTGPRFEPQTSRSRDERVAICHY